MRVGVTYVWLVFGLVVLASSSTLTVRESATPDYKENKQADATGTVVFSRRRVFCAARCCGIVHRQRVKVVVYLHNAHNGNVQHNPLCARSILSLLAYDFLSRCKFSTLNYSTPLYSKRLCAQNRVFEFVHEESMKVYHLHVYNGNVQQNPLCVQFCVTKKFSMSPRFSPSVQITPYINTLTSTLIYSRGSTSVRKMRAENVNWQRDWESCYRTRKRRILRSDTHWPSRRVEGILVRTRDGPRPA